MTEQCSWAPAGPEDMARCPNEATGGIRFTLRPAEATAERHAVKTMLSFIADMPVCASCFPQVTVHSCISFELRRSLARLAQKQAKNLPVDWSRTLAEHVPMDVPQYVALRVSQAANDSQSAPAGPQLEVTGDGSSSNG